MKTYKFTINGNQYITEINELENNQLSVEVNGTAYTVDLDTPVLGVVPVARPSIKVSVPAPPKAAPAQVAVAPAPMAPSGGSTIKSPLPGAILDIFVRIGDTVKPGQRLLLLEAMKMENNIDADKEGVVRDIRVQRGDSVMEGDILIVIE
ncbi:MAG: acetyl-CoA carboxylase biotin carboxyl carrier protein subunit [Bacteroidales bacterium]|jgi:biotin carboxyl carrier protein|nr:acetyl-CoA carboxylase biotin carboxyl carrier protein subunit [Bacteroidales bacterium]